MKINFNTNDYEHTSKELDFDLLGNEGKIISYYDRVLLMDCEQSFWGAIFLFIIFLDLFSNKIPLLLSSTKTKKAQSHHVETKMDKLWHE